MIREIFLGDFSLSSCMWQSTIFLVVGLVSSFILRHRSSRAHQVLFLSMIAAVIVPVISTLVKHYELGVFVAEPVVIQSPAKDWATASISAEDIEHKPGPIEEHLPSAMAGSEIAEFPWRSVMLYVWIAASLILAARLLLTFALGVRLLGRALPLDCQRIKEAVHLAKAKLGIDKDVKVRRSRGVRSPVIWCWKRRPILLVPSAAGRFDNGVDWAGVLCHELAHWKRRDHVSGLLTELVVCILPWHPLLWWAKSRLVRLSEQACDDWVVATGQPGTDYAESLLDLTPGGQMAFVPAVVRSKKGLPSRVHRILEDNCSNPRTGAVWALIVSLVVLCLTVGIAFAQTRPDRTADRAVKESQPGEVRVVHFPKERSVGTLKVRDISSDDDADSGLLSLPGWVILGQAQGDVSVPAGKDLSLEIYYEEVADLFFLADLKPDDLQVLICNTETTDDDLVHIKGLTGLLGLDLAGTTIKGPGLVHLSTLTSLRKLGLFNTQVSDAGLAHLSTLKSLKYLNLFVTQVKGPGLKHLKSLTSLVHIDLAATPITNESLVHLAEMTWLKELELQDTDIGNKGLANLKPLRSLEELILGYADLKQGYSPITDEGLVYLKELDSLKTLYLLRTRVTDAGLAHLRNLKKLEALLLTETQITGEGLAFLKDLPELKSLDLNKTAVTDEGLVYLKDLKSLSKLYISSDSISEADLEDLEKALPNCTINGRKSIATVRPPKPEPVPAENEQQSDVQVEGKGAVEPVQIKKLVEIEKRFESAKKLSNLGKALRNYADDYEDRFPDSMQKLQGYPYLNEEEFEWALANVKYLAKGKMLADPPDVILAYDKKILTEGMGTNILRNDTYVGFVKFEELKKLGIGATAILIDTKILSVSEDFLKDIGLDANSVSSSGAWSEHLAAKYPAEPNDETYSLILDDLHISFLLRATQAHKDAYVLAAPQVMCQEGKTAEIRILQNESYYVSSYTEPNRPYDKPEPKVDKVEPSTRFWVTPKLTPDNENIELDFELEIRQLLGFEERKYEGKYPYKIPKVDVVSTKARYLVPDSKTLLIGGQKITGEENGQKVQKRLLVLIKAKMLDSEEHIKSLARQLEKKLKRSAEQRRKDKK